MLNFNWFIFHLVNILSVLQEIYSSSLTTNNQIYIRDCSEPNFYYESIQVEVIESGYYTFLSYSRIDTYGYIYKDKFNPLNPLENLLHTNDDGGFNFQFRLDIRLFVDMKYVLVVTTSDSRGTGKFSIAVFGRNKITLEHLSEYM